jgi:hypothetical protein
LAGGGACLAQDGEPVVNVVTDAGRQSACRCGDPGVEGRKAVVVQQAEQVEDAGEAGTEDLVGAFGGGKVAAADAFAAGVAAPGGLEGPPVRGRAEPLDVRAEQPDQDRRDGDDAGVIRLQPSPTSTS